MEINFNNYWMEQEKDFTSLFVIEICNIVIFGIMFDIDTFSVVLCNFGIQIDI